MMSHTPARPRRESRPIPLLLLLGLAQSLIGLGPAPAAAGPDEATDVVAPYIHLAIGLPPATGPLSTVFLIRSARSVPVQVFVTCFNNQSQQVGPFPPFPQSASINIAAHQTSTFTPDEPGPFNLTIHPAFTGIGWCYFSSNDKFSVEVAWGLYGGPPGTIAFNGSPDPTPLRMFSSNASVGVAIAAGQATVAGGSVVVGPPVSGFGDVPLWLSGNWVDVLVLVNPTALVAQMSIDVFACAGCSPMPAPTTVTFLMPARGMGLVLLSSFAGAFTNGNATIRSGTTCCFVGWHWALNGTTRQALFREVSLDRDTTRFLSVTDRP